MSADGEAHTGSGWPTGVGRIALGSVDSTNAEGFRRAAAGLAGPCWILAAEQTAGRGRRARPWASPVGNLYATLVLPVSGPPHTIALRSFAASLALHDALTAATGSAEGLALKWPNDVLLGGAKVAGILLECQSTPAGQQILTIGIGVNLIGHPDPATLDPDATPPTSVLNTSGHRLTPAQFLSHLAPACAAWEATFTTAGFAPLRTAWLARAARLGEPIRARTGQTTHHGLFDSIDDAGNLILRTPTTTLAIPAAEVFF